MYNKTGLPPIIKALILRPDIIQTLLITDNYAIKDVEESHLVAAVRHPPRVARFRCSNSYLMTDEATQRKPTLVTIDFFNHPSTATKWMVFTDFKPAKKGSAFHTQK